VPHKTPESAAWLNSLLSSLWPIINPALFNPLMDMLEDAMQATLPKLVKGVRVADFGQGNESMRILGIRWLEAGDAAEERHGMSSKEGDFASFEIAVAYRSRPTGNMGRGLKGRSRNAHLLIEFWSVGGLRLPVWVEVKGVLATARIRVQLTPNPPFLNLAIITLLGQPKVNVSCVPIAKNFLNIMDIPVMNEFLQNSIDQAISMYVAPRSLTLDLKTLLTGAEKLDTDAIGVIVVRVISAENFKDGDGSKKWLSDAKKRGDPYVTVGWGKWGKGMWNTR
jgi:Ca2+-dependent lipid-binding protein